MTYGSHLDPPDDGLTHEREDERLQCYFCLETFPEADMHEWLQGDNIWAACEECCDNEARARAERLRRECEQAEEPERDHRNTRNAERKA